MKLLCACIFLTFYGVVFAESVFKSRLTYQVVSNEKDSSLDEGKCKISGRVTFNGEPLEYAKISTGDHLTKTVTDSLGNYELMIDVSKDSVLYLFKPRYREIVVMNVEFKSQHHLKIDFYAYQEFRNTAVKKPVIYLYDQQERALDLALDFRSNLTFSYPEYENGWSVNMSANGSISHQTKNYPYLFWEGETAQLNYQVDNDKPRGSIIKTDTVISFLENTLTQFCLNPTEKTDFITFWGPLLQHKDYAFIQFIYDQEYDRRIAGISTSIQPDYSLRLFMLYTGYDESPSLRYQPQVFPRLIREGDFQLIEWGGSIIPYESLNRIILK